MLTKKQRDDMRAFASSWLSECLDDLDEKDEAIVDLQTTAEGEIQHTDVMDSTVERLKKELVAKDKRIRELEAYVVEIGKTWRAMSGNWND